MKTICKQYAITDWFLVAVGNSLVMYVVLVSRRMQDCNDLKRFYVGSK